MSQFQNQENPNYDLPPPTVVQANPAITQPPPLIQPIELEELPLQFQLLLKPNEAKSLEINHPPPEITSSNLLQISGHSSQQDAFLERQQQLDQNQQNATLESDAQSEMNTLFNSVGRPPPTELLSPGRPQGSTALQGPSALLGPFGLKVSPALQGPSGFQVLSAPQGPSALHGPSAPSNSSMLQRPPPNFVGGGTSHAVLLGSPAASEFKTQTRKVNFYFQ